ncbi:MAG: FHA domain-containing protein, partial [Deltaproteobacteria bacterium]|nr:FHA domain-containing protein [Deltaproteobacteria bacterium]
RGMAAHRRHPAGRAAGWLPGHRDLARLPTGGRAGSLPADPAEGDHQAGPDQRRRGAGQRRTDAGAPARRGCRPGALLPAARPGPLARGPAGRLEGAGSDAAGALRRPHGVVEGRGCPSHPQGPSRPARRPPGGHGCSRGAGAGKSGVGGGQGSAGAGEDPLHPLRDDRGRRQDLRGQHGGEGRGAAPRAQRHLLHEQGGRAERGDDHRQAVACRRRAAARADRAPHGRRQAGVRQAMSASSPPDHSATRTIFLDGVAVGLSLRRYTLEVVRGPDQGLRTTFEQRQISVGTAPDNSLCLNDETVSRRHCRIEVDGSGYRLVDLGSKNGTKLGPYRIREAYLSEGAIIGLGGTELRWTPGDQEVEVHFSPSTRFGALRGSSLAMREIFAVLERVAPTEATVLIEGESGTGKELVAREIHERSRRSAGPLIVFDCSAVPRELIESELFGHVKGAFTGATANRMGAFEQAKGGTLFLDELGELSLDLQPKLLRALESRTIRPVGGTRPVQTDLRVVAATNRNLLQEVEEGSFREDLYYRLAVIKVRLPPLRERPEDVPLLVRHFIRELGGNPEQLKVSYETMERLKNHPWPGNVRELRNFIERTVVL